MSERVDDPYQPPALGAAPAEAPPAPSALFYKRNELREMTWKVLAVVLSVKLAEQVAWLGEMARNHVGMAWAMIPLATLAWFIGYSYYQSRRYERIVDGADNENEITVDIVSLLQRVFFSVLGVYLIATQASDFVLSVLRAYSAVAGLYVPPTWLHDAGSILAFAAGFALFFGGNAISRFWFRIRAVGVEPTKAR